MAGPELRRRGAVGTRTGPDWGPGGPAGRSRKARLGSATPPAQGSGPRPGLRETRASSQRLLSRAAPVSPRPFVCPQPAWRVPKSRLSKRERRAAWASAPSHQSRGRVACPARKPSGAPTQAHPGRRGFQAARGSGPAGSQERRRPWIPGFGLAGGAAWGFRSGPVLRAPPSGGRLACPPAPRLPGDCPAGLEGGAQGRGRERGCSWCGRPAGLLRPPGALRAGPATGGGPAPELRAAAGAGSVCAAMKRDRRGRFLPVALAARIGSEPPPAETGRPDSVSRTRRRRAAAAREEKTAPEPKRWASPAAEAAAAAAVPGIPRALTTGFCRLCHGKFSSRSLRNAFGKVPMVSEDSEEQRRLDQVFFTDFQRLVGVTVQQDPSLPPFVCKKCHAQFYKCRSILKAFIQKVNVSPVGHPKPRGKNNLAQPSLSTASAGEGEAPCLDLITSSPQCLHQLVRWSHGHAENCPMAPSLQSVLSSKYCGIIRAVWGCEEGHNYIMSTDSDCSTLLVDSALAVQWELKKDTPRHVTGNGVASDSSGAAIPSLQHQHGAAKAMAGQQPADSGTALPASSAEDLVPESRGLPSLQDPLQEDLLQAASPQSGSPGRPSEKLSLSAASDERVKDAFSDLSEGESSNEDENHKRAQSSDESFEPYPEKRVSNNRKVESKEANLEEPKTRKKPGPKPGWKKKIKCEREELPNIYKCPYQGCTAVYRGADGMKKHIKEHHEEVRERPCPHPGCNKVFMIDRYLQRHVKLIHTEVRNYICDECGQTFKQRKHLSVHQMRHSGAKPLQCEICGFQCRQRASLKYHMTKHKAETELEFACDQCGKRFEKAHNLNVHMSMVHPLTQTQERAKEGEPEPKPLLDTVEGQPIKVELSAQQEPT